MQKGQFGPICVGTALFADIVIFGPITGGHFNPAVTFGVIVREGMKNWKKNTIYCTQIVFAQCVGAFIGCWISFLATTHDDNHKARTFVLCPNYS